jgi:26S proteasome regulatory subunit N2
MAIAVKLSSCGSLLASLNDDSQSIQTASLQRLHGLVDEHWAEISDKIDMMLAQCPPRPYIPAKPCTKTTPSPCGSPPRSSQPRLPLCLTPPTPQVLYHLEQYDQALKYALSAEELFDVSRASEFSDTLISTPPSPLLIPLDKAIDHYIAAKSSPDEAAAPIDPRLDGLIERMFQRSPPLHPPPVLTVTDASQMAR